MYVVYIYKKKNKETIVYTSSGHPLKKSWSPHLFPLITYFGFTQIMVF